MRMQVDAGWVTSRGGGLTDLPRPPWSPSTAGSADGGARLLRRGATELRGFGDS
jgi:hypothetical protein